MTESGGPTTMNQERSDDCDVGARWSKRAVFLASATLTVMAIWERLLERGIDSVRQTKHATTYTRQET